MALTTAESLQHAQQAGRGNLNSLEILLNSIVVGEAGAELQFLDGVVAGVGAASKAVVLDASGDVAIPGEVELDGNILAVEAGVGITAGTGTIYKSSVIKIGGIIKTMILLDITGLDSSTTNADIIGVDDTGVAHLGQITALRNGTILTGRMTCIEAPATGDPDIDLYSAAEATGVEDTLITALTETALLAAAASWTAGLEKVLTALPAANEYLYLVVGNTGVPATYTAGKFLIELEGYDA